MDTNESAERSEDDNNQNAKGPVKSSLVLWHYLS